MSQNWILTLEETAGNPVPVVAENVWAETLEKALEIMGPGYRESTDEEYERYLAYWGSRD